MTVSQQLSMIYTSTLRVVVVVIRAHCIFRSTLSVFAVLLKCCKALFLVASGTGFGTTYEKTYRDFKCMDVNIQFRCVFIIL